MYICTPHRFGRMANISNFLSFYLSYVVHWSDLSCRPIAVGHIFENPPKILVCVWDAALRLRCFWATAADASRW